MKPAAGTVGREPGPRHGARGDSVRQILHFSDIHLGPHFLDEVGEGVLELAEQRRPDVAIVSGDLTHRAKRRQFRAARAYLDRFPVPTLAVPGNHDVPMYRFWERTLAPYRSYRRHFSANLEPVHEDDEMTVLGVNTAFSWTIKDGRMTHERLDRLAEQLAAVPEGKLKVVVAHHQLVPPPRFDSRRVLKNARKTVEVLTHGGADMVLSGHLHQCWVASSEAYYPSGRDPVLLVHSGTTTSTRGRGVERRRNTCNWIVVDERSVTVDHLRWHGESGRFLVLSRHRFPRRRRQPYALEPSGIGETSK